MAEKVLIVKYGEIAMRGNNQYIFINRLISAIRKNLTGASEVMFKNCDKKVYLSRSYYRLLRDKLGEVRNLK